MDPWDGNLDPIPITPHTIWLPSPWCFTDIDFSYAYAYRKPLCSAAHIDVLTLLGSFTSQHGMGNSLTVDTPPQSSTCTTWDLPVLPLSSGVCTTVLDNNVATAQQEVVPPQSVALGRKPVTIQELSTLSELSPRRLLPSTLLHVKEALYCTHSKDYVGFFASSLI